MVRLRRTLIRILKFLYGPRCGEGADCEAATYSTPKRGCAKPAGLKSLTRALNRGSGSTDIIEIVFFPKRARTGVFRSLLKAYADTDLELLYELGHGAAFTVYCRSTSTALSRAMAVT
jgi:hypothetical protein